MKCSKCGRNCRGSGINFCPACGSPLIKHQRRFDCPNYDNVNCECYVLKDMLCERHSECGFYPPTAKARIAKMRQDRCVRSGIEIEEGGEKC